MTSCKRGDYDVGSHGCSEHRLCPFDCRVNIRVWSEILAYGSIPRRYEVFSATASRLSKKVGFVPAVPRTMTAGSAITAYLLCQTIKQRHSSTKSARTIYERCCQSIYVNMTSFSGRLETYDCDIYHVFRAVQRLGYIGQVQYRSSRPIVDMNDEGLNISGQGY